MRTITDMHLERLQLQMEEAKTLKLDKVASSLEHQIKKNANAQRDDEEDYIYSEAEMKRDVNNALWDAAVRVSDFLGAVPDAAQVNDLLDKYAQNLFQEIAVLAHVPDGVGAHEPTVPGEDRQTVVLEVDDEYEG